MHICVLIATVLGTFELLVSLLVIIAFCSPINFISVVKLLIDGIIACGPKTTLDPWALARLLKFQSNLSNWYAVGV